MRIFKNITFSKWAAKEKLSDEALRLAVLEIEHGILDADLGGYVIKKRVALGTRGKSAGVRTLLAYVAGNKAFFMYGFAKSSRENISITELRALKFLAKELLAYNDELLTKACENGALIEVKQHG
jgi:hypothetical protein